jgi:hypothetical protein
MKFSVILLVLVGGFLATGCRHTYEPAPQPYYCQPACGCAPACTPSCNPCAPTLQPTPTVIPRGGAYVAPPAGGTYVAPGANPYPSSPSR